MSNGHSNANALLVAIDNSEACLKAIEFCQKNFPSGWKYHLLHVQSPPPAMPIASAAAAGLYYDAQQAEEQEQFTTTTKFLEEVFVPKAAAGGATVESTVLETGAGGAGNIGAAICDYVAKVQPAALVIMRQNKNALSRFFMGSVSRYCAVHSAAPVIIVPMEG